MRHASLFCMAMLHMFELRDMLPCSAAGSFYVDLTCIGETIPA